jgi:hypothetical protein
VAFVVLAFNMIEFRRLTTDRKEIIKVLDKITADYKGIIKVVR